MGDGQSEGQLLAAVELSVAHSSRRLCLALLSLHILQERQLGIGCTHIGLAFGFLLIGGVH
jgi:hypothetical protein